jgi:uncharacterized membrane protein YeaQ/YmgE (transglycosylase-associated protein family)
MQNDVERRARAVLQGTIRQKSNLFSRVAIDSGGCSMGLMVWITSLQQDRVYVFGVSANRGLLAWIVIGLLAGWIAGIVTRGHGFGCIVNIVLGLIGAVIGGWIFSRLGIITWSFIGSLAAATVGAVVLVAIARLFAGGD